MDYAQSRIWDIVRNATWSLGEVKLTASRSRRFALSDWIDAESHKQILDVQEVTEA